MKPSLIYLGFCFLLFLVVGFIFGPRYLDLTPTAIVFLSIGGTLLLGLRELLKKISWSVLFGFSTPEEIQQMEEFHAKTTIVNDPVTVEALIDKVIKANPKISQMDMRKSATHDIIYWTIHKDNEVMVGNPKLIKKILRNR